MASIELTSRGLYCPFGGFYIDPWAPCPLAVITHAHGAMGATSSPEKGCRSHADACQRMRFLARISQSIQALL